MRGYSLTPSYCYAQVHNVWISGDGVCQVQDILILALPHIELDCLQL